MRNNLLLSLLLWTIHGHAAAPTNQPPMIDIKASTATYQFKTGAATFSGNVTVLDPDVRMNCQTLVATFKKTKTDKKNPKTTQKAPPASNTVRLASGDDIDRIEAIGSVVITSLSKQSAGTVGRADRAVYTAADRKIVMLGNRPNITRPNGETTTADKFVYDIEAGTFTGDGDVVTSFRRPKSKLFNPSTRPPNK